MCKDARLKIAFIAEDFSVDDLDSTAWDNAFPLPVTKYWNGEAVPDRRRAEARLLWSSSALYVRFDAIQSEPLVISDNPDLSKKTMFLWNRDVCEIFIAPDKNKRTRYFEFEIAPTGEWLDLGIEVTPNERLTDWDYKSNMELAARVETARVVIAIKIPFASLAITPKEGDVWLGNIFRCVGSGPTRGYLAWRPTETPEANFHVPEKFGEFRFVK